MPQNGFSDAELAAVDLSRGEERLPPSGERMRQVISKMYRCESREEEDYFLRRFLAS